MRRNAFRFKHLRASRPAGLGRGPPLALLAPRRTPGSEAVPRVVGLLLLLAFGIWLAGELPPEEGQGQLACQSDWRRTIDGWERLEGIVPPTPTRQPTLHPATVAAGQALLCLLALIALAPSERTVRRRSPA